MNLLITKALEEQDIQPLTEFPRFLLNEFEQKLVATIINYTTKYGKPPTPERLEKLAPSFVSLKTKDPLLDVADQTVERKKNDYATLLLEEELAALKKGKTFDVSKHISNLDQLALTSSTIHRYTTFDRSSYFRSGKPVTTGISLLDGATKGVYPGETLLLVGRLGVGKSTLLQFVLKQILESGKRRILCISKEMPAADVFARIDAIFATFNPLRLREQEEQEQLLPQLHVTQGIIKETGSDIIMPRLSIWDVENIHSMARTFNCDAIAIDGVYHLTSSEMGTGRAGWEKLTAVSRQIKAISLDLGVPTITTSQLKRGAGAAEKFSDEDIGYADALGQDADFVVGIRPLGHAKRNRQELQLIKNRYGAKLATLVDIHFDTMSIREISTQGET